VVSSLVCPSKMMPCCCFLHSGETLCLHVEIKDRNCKRGKSSYLQSFSKALIHSCEWKIQKDTITIEIKFQHEILEVTCIQAILFNMFKVLGQMLHKMYEQMGNFSKEMETLRNK
jgi:hypothetical protein